MSCLQSYQYEEGEEEVSNLDEMSVFFSDKQERDAGDGAGNFSFR